MSDGSHEPSAAPTATDREAVMAALGDAYAADQLELDELEQRMARVYRATSHEALSEVLQGLGRASVTAPPPTAGAPAYSAGRFDGSPPAYPSERAYEFGAATIARDGVVPDRAAMIAVFGGVERKGGWIVPRLIKAFAVMGGVDLDMREAHFAEGVTEIEVFALFGGVDIKVPTGVRVESTGAGIMGGFSVSSADADPGPDAPVLRISGIAIMGGVDAKLKRLRKAIRR